METTNSEETSFFNRPQGLARILALGDTTTDLWSPAEMQAMWQHQLSAPVQVDLATLHFSRLAQLSDSPEVQPFLANSFQHLLNHPSPPIELLKMTKDFAKQVLKSREDTQLNDVAAVLYHAAYAAGILRCQKRLGGMDEAELQRGFKWALTRRWLDESTRQLITQASDSLTSTVKSQPTSELD